MSVIRKHGKKFQVLIRRKDSPHIIKSFISKEAAREWARETEVNIERGFYTNSSYAQRTTLGQLLTEYRDRVSVNKKGYRTEMYRIGKISRHKVCKCTLFKLTKLKLLKFREEMLLTHNPSTCNKYISVISMAIDYAMEDLDMYLFSNVAQKIKTLKEPEYAGEIITLEEEKLLLEHAANSKAVWLKASIILAIDNGIRRGEIIKLLYQDVDFSKRTCKLRDTKGGVDRSIGLSTRSIDAIRELPRNIDGRVIACRDGDQFMWFWKQCRKSSGVKKTFHSTRATFCTRAAEDNWQLLDIAAQSGHKDVNVLRKHYAKLKAEYLSRKIKN